MRRRAALPAALATAAALGGCSVVEVERERVRTVETTRVEVVEARPGTEALDARELHRLRSPGVVTVISRFEGRRELLDEDGEGGLGSGFVLDGDGRIATNAHVVTTGQLPRIRRAREVYVEFASGDRVPARIVGHDPNADIALLRVDPAGLTLRPLPLGSSEGLAVGDPVAAIGSPFGERQSLSVGVISALDRDIESLTAFTIGGAIQTDAAINRGNSGGPLLDARGRVIGVSAQIKTDTGGGEGVGFAIPIDLARRSLRELDRHGRVDYALLGVTTLELYPQLARRLGLRVRRGALVADVTGGGPAERAGIRAGGRRISFQGRDGIPAGGDVIVGVEGRRLGPEDDLADLVALRRPGERVRLEVVRGSERREVVVRLGRRPQGPSGG